jgi:hypothetical protein
VALIPFFIIWFGVGLSGQVVLIELGCFMVLTVNTFTAVQLVPPVYVRAGIALGAPPAALYRTILLARDLAITRWRIPDRRRAGIWPRDCWEIHGSAGRYRVPDDGNPPYAKHEHNFPRVIIIALESYAFDALLLAAGRHLCRWTESPLDELQKSNAVPLDAIIAKRRSL